LYEYGINVGLAFQLQDDWLDVYGDPEVFGKEKGGDICANKKTCLLLKAAEMCDRPTLVELNDWLIRPDFDPEQKIAAVTAIFDKTGAGDATRDLMHCYTNKALKALEKMAIPAVQKNTLIAFSGEILKRIK
jgi:geranylgeranyl diphosphate synthase type II